MGGRRGRGAGQRPALGDVALAVGCSALGASVLATVPSWSPPPMAWALALAHTTPVAFRRAAPVAAFATSTAAAGFYLALDWPMVGLGLAALVMTYSLAAATDRRHSLVGLAAADIALVAAALRGPGPSSTRSRQPARRGRRLGAG